MRNMNDDNTPGIFSPPFTVIATICAGGNTYVMSSFASDGRRLGRASAMVDQPSGESPSPCKNMIAHLLFGDIVFTSSPSVVALFFSEGASTELFAIRKNVGMMLEDLNRELVEALKSCEAAFSKFAPQEESAYGMAWIKVRATLAKAKGVA